jgi:hypothetical protein
MSFTQIEHPAAGKKETTTRKRHMIVNHWSPSPSSLGPFKESNTLKLHYIWWGCMACTLQLRDKFTFVSLITALVSPKLKTVQILHPRPSTIKIRVATLEEKVQSKRHGLRISF